MKKFLVAAVFLFVFSLGASAFAHMPQDIIFKYIPDSKILSVGVYHKVNDLNQHFIKRIEIRLNGKELVAQNFLTQTNNNLLAVSYMVVDLKKGDTISIKAVCNQSGQLTQKFIIE